MGLHSACQPDQTSDWILFVDGKGFLFIIIIIIFFFEVHVVKFPTQVINPKKLHYKFIITIFFFFFL